jgi:hypothetical protein
VILPPYCWTPFLSVPAYALKMSSSGVNNYMFLLRGVCLATGAALHVAPIPTMNEIKSSRSTLNFHIAPYASTLLNQLINGYYAYVRRDPALMVHRTLGVLANSYYVYTYLNYVPTARLPDSQRFLTRVATIFFAFMLELHLFLPMESSFFSHLAVFAALTGIGLAASPLATVVRIQLILHLRVCVDPSDTQLLCAG